MPHFMIVLMPYINLLNLSWRNIYFGGIWSLYIPSEIKIDKKALLIPQYGMHSLYKKAATSKDFEHVCPEKIQIRLRIRKIRIFTGQNFDSQGYKLSLKILIRRRGCAADLRLRLGADVRMYVSGRFGLYFFFVFQTLYKTLK